MSFNNELKRKQGFALIGVLLVLGVLALGGGYYYTYTTTKESVAPELAEEENAVDVVEITNNA